MKYSINLDFFNVPSRELSYVLGFFMADGYMCKNEFGFYLSSKDEEILIKIKEAMGATHLVKRQTSKWGEYSRLRICNKSLAKIISDMGFIFPKTGNEFIPLICKDYMYDFIRGVIDGDGNVSVIRNNEPRLSICCSSKVFLSELSNFLGYGNIRKEGNYYSWTVYKIEPIQSLIKEMYNNTELFLTRKKETFLKVSEIKIKSPRFNEIEDSFIIHNFDKLSPKALAQKLNRPLGSVYSRISTLKKKKLI